MSERIFREKCDKLLAKLPNSWWESIQQKAIRGTPDKIGCVNGHFVAIEFKACKTAKVAPLQKRKRDLILLAGGRAYICYPENWDVIYEELKCLSK